MTFREAKADVRTAAAESFDKAQGEPENREQRQARNRFIDQAEREWFETQPLYASIEIQRDRRIEIRDAWFGGSIDIYPPERRREYDGSDKGKVRIVPGYINASSWCAGTHDATVQRVAQEMKHRMKMMAMALDELNKMNSLVLEWEDIESPFELREWEKDELDRFRRNQKEAIEKQNEKIERRKKRGGK